MKKYLLLINALMLCATTPVFAYDWFQWKLRYYPVQKDLWSEMRYQDFSIEYKLNFVFSDYCISYLSRSNSSAGSYEGLPIIGGRGISVRQKTGSATIKGLYILGKGNVLLLPIEGSKEWKRVTNFTIGFESFNQFAGQVVNIHIPRTFSGQFRLPLGTVFIENPFRFGADYTYTKKILSNSHSVGLYTFAHKDAQWTLGTSYEYKRVLYKYLTLEMKGALDNSHGPLLGIAISCGNHANYNPYNIDHQLRRSPFQESAAPLRSFMPHLIEDNSGDYYESTAQANARSIAFEQSDDYRNANIYLKKEWQTTIEALKKQPLSKRKKLYHNIALKLHTDKTGNTDDDLFGVINHVWDIYGLKEDTTR